MAKSMTGYGRAQEILSGRDITAEIKSVNHRFFEASVRVPRAYSFLEEKIRQHVQNAVSRGKLEVNITIFTTADGDSGLEVNMALARDYAEALTKMAEELDIRNDLSTAVIARMPDVFTIRREVTDEEALWNDVRDQVTAALDNYNRMRQTEGDRMAQDIRSRAALIRDRLTAVEAQAKDRLQNYREKLAQRMKNVLENTAIDENRILLEAALYADKSAIDEETVRLNSHLDQLDQILSSGEPIGRKLDFLVQEINREVNTIGSKAADFDIQSVVVDIKAEIEKIREQIQNIE